MIVSNGQLNSYPREWKFSKFPTKCTLRHQCAHDSAPGHQVIVCAMLVSTYMRVPNCACQKLMENGGFESQITVPRT